MRHTVQISEITREDLGCQQESLKGATGTAGENEVGEAPRLDDTHDLRATLEPAEISKGNKGDKGFAW